MRALPDRCRIAPDGEPEPEGAAGVNGKREGLPVILDHAGDARGLCRGEGLPVFSVILGKPGGAAAWMICHGRQGRKPGGLPVIDHGSQSPDQDARRDARKKIGKKLKRGLRLRETMLYFRCLFSKANRAFISCGITEPAETGETGSLPKRIFLFWGIMLACVKPTW